MSTSRSQGKQYHPVLCRVKLFPMSGKSVVIIENDAADMDGHVLPFHYRGDLDGVLLQRVMLDGELCDAVNPADMTPDQRADAMGASWVIAWVPEWLITNFAKEGRGLKVMTPAVPVKEKS